MKNQTELNKLMVDWLNSLTNIVAEISTSSRQLEVIRNAQREYIEEHEKMLIKLEHLVNKSKPKFYRCPLRLSKTLPFSPAD